MKAGIPFLSLLFLLAPALLEQIHSEIHSEFKLATQTRARGWGEDENLIGTLNQLFSIAAKRWR